MAQTNNFDLNKLPVKKGQRIELEIIGIGSKGDGFGKIDNYVIFVNEPNLQRGETVQIEITNVTEKQAFSKRL